MEAISRTRVPEAVDAPVEAEVTRPDKEAAVEGRKEEERQGPGEEGGSTGSGIIGFSEVGDLQSHQVESQ